MVALGVILSLVVLILSLVLRDKEKRLKQAYDEIQSLIDEVAAKEIANKSQLPTSRYKEDIYSILGEISKTLRDTLFTKLGGIAVDVVDFGEERFIEGDAALSEFYASKVSVVVDVLLKKYIEIQGQVKIERQNATNLLEAYDMGAKRPGIGKLSKEANDILASLANSTVKHDNIYRLTEGIKRLKEANNASVSILNNGDNVIENYKCDKYLKQVLLSCMKHDLYLIDQEIKSVK